MNSTIDKLAKLLSADFFVWEKGKQPNEIKDEYLNKIFTNKNSLLWQQKSLVFKHTYTLISYNYGYILTCQVTKNEIICFSFVYEKLIQNKKILRTLYSLQNEKSILQIIFSIWNHVKAPNDELYIINIDSKKERHSTSDYSSNIVPFNSQLFFDTETDIIRAIVYSKKRHLINALENLSEIDLISEHLTANNIIQEKKYILVSYIAILNRAIIQWGYPSKLAYQLQCALIQEIELSLQFFNFFQNIKEISWRYFNLVKNYRLNNFLPLHQRIRQYIKQHIRDNITLADIASELVISQTKLNPAFKKEYGITIIQFIRHTKVEIAKELLIASNMSILEISEFLSFSTTTYFVKTFKNVSGVTPALFRKNSRNGKTI